MHDTIVKALVGYEQYLTEVRRHVWSQKEIDDLAWAVSTRLEELRKEVGVTADNNEAHLSDVAFEVGLCTISKWICEKWLNEDDEP